MSKEKPSETTPLRILLVEDEPAVCAEFLSDISAWKDMELVGVTGSSFKAIEMIRDLQPEALILDLELQKGSGNGLMLLQDMNSLDDASVPYTIVTTNNNSHTTQESLRRFNVGFIFTKYQEGYTPRSALSFLHLMMPTILEQRKEKSGAKDVDSPAVLRQLLRKKIRAEFDRLGMSPKVLGYNYLVEAVCLTAGHPTPNLGTVIGKIYGKSGPSVERAMKNAIERVWDSVPLDDLTANYTAHINPDRGVPTVMEFISYYSDKIKNEMC